MLRLGSSRTLLIGGTFLAGAAAVFALTGRIAESEGGVQPAQLTLMDRPAKSRTSRHGTRGLTRMEREIRALSLQQVRAELPATASPQLLSAWGGSERAELIFRRYGALEGEQALDEILSRYGRGAFTARAMSLAIMGWMEVDRRAALAAFRDLSTANQLAFGLAWKGTNILSGFG